VTIGLHFIPGLGQISRGRYFADQILALWSTGPDKPIIRLLLDCDVANDVSPGTGDPKKEREERKGKTMMPGGTDERPTPDAC
jgi:hypothetical protein